MTRPGMPHGHDLADKMKRTRIKTDKNHAQILLKTGDSATVERARIVIESLGITILRTETLSEEESSKDVLFVLDIKDMRDVALELIGNGIKPIEGYNASSLKL